MADFSPKAESISTTVFRPSRQSNQPRLLWTNFSSFATENARSVARKTVELATGRWKSRGSPIKESPPTSRGQDWGCWTIPRWNQKRIPKQAIGFSADSTLSGGPHGLSMVCFTLSRQSWVRTRISRLSIRLAVGEVCSCKKAAKRIADDRLHGW